MVGEGCKVKSVHTANRIRDPPRRERRQLPRMKKGLGGGGEGASKVVDCGIDGRGRGGLQPRVAGNLGHRSVSQEYGCWTGHERELSKMGKKMQAG